MSDNIYRYTYATVLILIFLQIALYFGYLLKFSSNIPFWDDFDVHLKFLITLSEFHGSDFEKISLFFSQHNEHRLFTTRLITYILYWVTGSVHFQVFMLVGSLFLVWLTLLFYLDFSVQGHSFLYFAPVVLILFNVANWGNMIWSMASIQNYGVLFFALGSIFFSAQSGRASHLTALCLAILATFTSGNGLLAFPIIAFVYFIRYKYGEMTTALILMSATACAYFFNYVSPSALPIQRNLLPAIKYFVLFTGSFLSMKSMTLGYFSGIFTLIYFLWLIRMKYYKNNPFLFGAMLFIFLSGIAASAGRSVLGDLSMALNGRYRIFSTTLFALIYLSFLQCASLRYSAKLTRKAVVIVLLFNVALSISCDIFFKNKLEGEQKRRIFAITHLDNKEIVEKTIYPNIENAKLVLQKSSELGIYSSPYK